MTVHSHPIGVFDSGVGGLTVLRALLGQLPHERFVYLGDTARLPYGTKSADTVVRYALQAADALVGRGVKALVIACNTASSVALPALSRRFADLPVIGVVEPGAQAAVAASASGRIAVIGTEATVREGAYQRAIVARRPDAQVLAAACQLFVALAEEGWTEGVVAQAAARRYLEPLFGGRDAHGARSCADTLVLGCTHFPMLTAVIRAVVGARVAIVDSAVTTARATERLLHERALLADAGKLAAGSAAVAVAMGATAASAAALAPVRLLATDGAARFAAVGARFLGRPIAAEEIELIDL
ncbi:MAG TPA: glutamate racemase [Steroidobacteraceae bacterium]|jgi:glutamate racemase|nr:glutamate racemase [Steroidobacteraceae bacterium]